MSMIPMPSPRATAATTFPKFLQLPRELQMMVWEAYLEDAPAVRHCFNLRTFGRTYTTTNPGLEILKTVLLEKNDADRLWRQPLMTLLGKNKMRLSGKHHLPGPTLGTSEQWDALSIQWTKDQYPVETYVDFQKDIFFGSNVAPRYDVLAYLGGPLTTKRYGWIAQAENIALRIPGGLRRRDRYTLGTVSADDKARLARRAPAMRMLYLVVDPAHTRCWKTRNVLRDLADFAADPDTGFIDFDVFAATHGARLLLNGLPVCRCDVQEHKARGLVEWVQSNLDLPPNLVIKVVLDGVLQGLELRPHGFGAWSVLV